MKPFIERWGRWLTIEWDEIIRAERWFGTRGWLIVGVGRLLPTIRSIISVPAGLLRMRLSIFFLASTIGTAAWTALLAGSGYLLGAHYRDIDRIIGPLSNLIMALLVTGYVWRLWRQRRTAAIAPSSES
jgi:membrane protein DedA with SNARE-associated domain